MAEILLRDLTPGSSYAVQLRSVADDGSTSEWSVLQTIVISGDILAPKAVTGLTATSVGTAFLATWTAPTQNTDNSTLQDLRDYQVDVIAGAVTKTYYTTAPRFDFSFEMNVAAFGTPQATITFAVYARDLHNNVSAVATSAPITNPAPPAPGGQTASGMVDAIEVRWTASAANDIDHYEVFFGPTATGAWTLVFSGNVLSAVIKTTLYTDQYALVKAVDVFGTPSTNTTATAHATASSGAGSDLTPPDAPATLSTSGETIDALDPSGAHRQVTLTWTLTGSPGVDLAGYTLSYKRSSDTAWNFIDIPDYNILTTVLHGLLPLTTYNIRIQAYDYTGNMSGATAATNLSTGSDTTAPNTPSTPTAYSSTQRIQVSHDLKDNGGTNLASDLSFLEVYISTSSGFTPNKTTNYVGNITVATPPVSGAPIPALGTFYVSAVRSNDSDTSTSKTYYVKVIAVDNSGNSSTASAQATATPGLIDNLAVAYAGITDANIQNLTVTKLVAGTGVVNDFTIKSTLTLGTNVTPGSIQSWDWSASSSGFRMSSSGLEINSGAIKASTLLLQDSVNIIPNEYADFELSSSFYTGKFTLSGATASISSTAYRGLQGLFVSASSAPSIDFTPSSSTYNVLVSGDSTYIVSAYIYQASGSSKTFNIRYRDNSTLSTGSVFGGVVNSGVWTRISTTVIAPTNATYMWFGVSCSSTVSFYLDNVQVERQVAALSSPSPWKPPSITTIDGGMIKTGTIQSNTVTTFGQASGTQPLWSINLSGVANFASAVVRGHLTIGDSSGSGLLTDQWIRSANYSPGSAGFSVDGNGDGEFNAITLNVTGADALNIGSGPGKLGLIDSGSGGQLSFYGDFVNSVGHLMAGRIASNVVGASGSAGYSWMRINPSIGSGTPTTGGTAPYLELRTPDKSAGGLQYNSVILSAIDSSGSTVTDADAIFSIKSYTLKVDNDITVASNGIYQSLSRGKTNYAAVSGTLALGLTDTNTNLTGFTVSTPVVSGRMYRVMLVIPNITTSTASTPVVTINIRYSSSTPITSGNTSAGVFQDNGFTTLAATTKGLTFFGYFFASATTTWYVGITAKVSAGTGSINAGSGTPILIVEDIGK